MTRDDYNTHCAALPAATHVVQWGGAHVWKVGVGPGQTGKVFAVASQDADAPLAVTFKCSDIVYEVLRDAPGCRPAPYLASRGMLWIQRTSDASVSDDELKSHLTESWRWPPSPSPESAAPRWGWTLSHPRPLPRASRPILTL